MRRVPFSHCAAPIDSAFRLEAIASDAGIAEIDLADGEIAGAGDLVEVGVLVLVGADLDSGLPLSTTRFSTIRGGAADRGSDTATAILIVMCTPIRDTMGRTPIPRRLLRNSSQRIKIIPTTKVTKEIRTETG